MNQTTNYRLNQWDAADPIRREDFNSDNAKLDAALGAETAAREAAVNALNGALAGCGNCRICTTSYTGTGGSGEDSPNTLTFPGRPLVVFLWEPKSGGEMLGLYGSDRIRGIGSSGSCVAIWSGATCSWYTSDGAANQYNTLSKVYQAAALLAADT